MAISFVTSDVSANNTTTSLSITLPATQANDILIFEFTHRGSGDGTIGGTSITTGGLTWAQKHSQLYASSAFSGKTLWTRATGDHSGQTITASGLTNSCAGVLTIYRGAVTSGDPLADATIVGEQNASGNETQAEITTATNGAWVVLVVANSPDVAVTNQACTSPGTLAPRAEKLNAGGTDTSIAHASAEKASAGATGAFTWSQTDGAGGSWAYAIKPDPNLTLALTGEASTTAAGSVDNTADVAVTGEASTSAAGTSEPGLGKTPTGQEIASAQGDVTAEIEEGGGEAPPPEAAAEERSRHSRRWQIIGDPFDDDAEEDQKRILYKLKKKLRILLKRKPATDRGIYKLTEQIQLVQEKIENVLAKIADIQANISAGLQEIDDDDEEVMLLS